MSVWILDGYGAWDDASHWNGGVPNSVGAVAVFDSTGSPRSGNSKVFFWQNSQITVGHLEIIASHPVGYSFVGQSGATSWTLRMAAFIGESAVIDVDANGTATEISGGDGGHVILASNTDVITRDITTNFTIGSDCSPSAPMAQI